MPWSSNTSNGLDIEIGEMREEAERGIGLLLQLPKAEELEMGRNLDETKMARSFGSKVKL